MRQSQIYFVMFFYLFYLKNTCTAIAVALHYMFLTDFAMMLAEGILIVRMVIIVFPTKSIVNWLLPACWGEYITKMNTNLIPM